MGKINLQNLHAMCKGLMNWDQDYVERRFQGSSKELIDVLNCYEDQEIHMFLMGFFCDNPIVICVADGNIDLRQLTTDEKVKVFIKRGKIWGMLSNGK